MKVVKELIDIALNQPTPDKKLVVILVSPTDPLAREVPIPDHLLVISLHCRIMLIHKIDEILISF